MLRDCLHLNWAFRADQLPQPQRALRYQLHSLDGVDYAFGSALLFRRERVRVPRSTKLNLSHPQLDFRWQVLSEEGAPAVLLHRILVPAWLAPGARLLIRHAVETARFGYPTPSSEPDAGSWSWRVEGPADFDATARRAAPRVGTGPSLGSWEATTRYFTDRPVGFIPGPAGLRRVQMERPQAAVWPLVVDLAESALLDALMPVRPVDGWQGLHSAFLCPEVPVSTVRMTAADPSLAGGLPAPG